MSDMYTYTFDDLDWQGDGPIQQASIDLYLGETLALDATSKRATRGPGRYWCQRDTRPGLARRSIEWVGAPIDYSPALAYRLPCPTCGAKPGQRCDCNSRPYPLG